MATSAPYMIQSGNATAVNILRSWLQAVGIPCTVGKDAIDLYVGHVIGGSIKVAVLREGKAPAGADIVIEAHEMTGKRVEKALEAFYRVTDAAGWDRRQPVNRGEAPVANEKGNPRKLNYKNEEFLVGIRHTEFRRSPNPPPDRWQQYKKTMDVVVRSFWNYPGNEAFFRRQGFERQDLMQYARCFVVNFCGRYETATPLYCDNERKLHIYLRQRFVDLLDMLRRKSVNASLDRDTFVISIFGDPNWHSGKDMFEEDVDEEYVERHRELDVTTARRRRNSATAKLKELLQQLPHDQLLAKLEETSENDALDITTQKEAERWLKEHRIGCIVCSPSCSRTELPQADRFSTIRLFLDGQHQLSRRQAVYYRTAALTLCLIDETGAVTDLGRGILLAGAGTPEESQVFYQAVLGAPKLASFRWFFEDVSKTREDLLAFMADRWPFAKETLARRAHTLNRWRKQLSDLGVKKDEDAAATDLGGVDE